MGNILNYEYFNFIVFAVFIPLAIWGTVRISDNILYVIAGTVFTILSVILLGMYLRKYIIVSKMDFYRTPVLELQKKFLKYKQYHNQIIKTEILTIPILVLSLSAITLKSVKNVDILSVPAQNLITTYSFALIVGYGFLFWLYKSFYGKRLKNINDFIEELKEFEEK